MATEGQRKDSQRQPSSSSSSLEAVTSTSSGNPVSSPPWAEYLGGTFSFSGPVSDINTNERLSLRLAIGRDASFRYDTQLYDGGLGYTLESMTGRLALPNRGVSETHHQGHDFVLEVHSTRWQAGSWNGEGGGDGTERKRFTVWRRGADALLVDTKELRREGGDKAGAISSKL